jgi:hypothetical protein
MRKALTYTAALIGGYLVLANFTGFGKDLSAASSAYNSGVKTLQGR